MDPAGVQARAHAEVTEGCALHSWELDECDGQVDFKGIFSKLTQYGFTGWAVLEWECCLKDSAQGAAEGAPFIASHIIEPSKYAFDDFAGGDVSEAKNNRILGLER